MAGFDNQYPNLPGHLAILKDGNLNLKEDPAPAPTESIVFLGTATDGPLMQPVRVTPQTANQIFGKFVHPNGVPNGATLLPAFEEAWEAGCRDIRLMRISGTLAQAVLKAATYSEVQTNIETEELGLSQGNGETTFTLPHGGIDPSSVEVFANGIKLVGAAYDITAGVASDQSAGTDPEVKATVKVKADVTDMKAYIRVRYTYDYIDAGGTPFTDVPVDTSTDVNGDIMRVDGQDKVFTIKEAAKAGAKLYADGAEISDESVFTVDPVAKTVTVHETDKIIRGQLLEISYAYDKVEIIEPELVLESVYGGILYNDLKVKVENNSGLVTITIYKPEGKKASMSEPPMVFKSTDYPTFQLLINAINSHPDNNVIRASSKYLSQLTNTLNPVLPEKYFTGGSDELNLSKDELYKRLGGERDSEGYIIKRGAYQLLENYKVDYVVPLGVYANDKLIGKYDNFAYQLALACAVMSHYNNVTFGFIPVAPPKDTDLAGIQDYVDELAALPNTFYMRDRFGNEIKDEDGNKIDLGQFIEILAGPELVVRNSRLGLVASSSYASYIGFVTTLPVQSSPMNKPIGSVQSLRYELSAAQLDKLTAARYTTFRYKINGTGVAATDAMTAAHAGSDYTRLTTARIVKAAVNQVREAADPFLGEPNDSASRNALSAAIGKRLGKMRENKALTAFDVRIISTPQMELLGEASVELSLRAPRELRKITTIVSLTV
jgi:hypothetical protein